jgi:hypothetical protein
MGGESADGVMLMAKAGVIKPYPWVEVFGKEMPGIAAALYDDVPELRGLSLHYFDAVSGIAWNPNSHQGRGRPQPVDGAGGSALARQVRAQFLHLFSAGPNGLRHRRTGRAGYRQEADGATPEPGERIAAVARAISAGTSPMGVTSFHAFERATVNKEPMKFKLFADVIPVSPLNLYVIEKAPHVNTGRLFAAWFAGRRGCGGRAVRAAAQHGDPNSKLSKLLKAQVAATNAKIAKPVSAQAIDDLVELRKTMQQQLTGQSAN